MSKPIWIVDDDESIRWVLEKALARENMVTRSFSHPDEVIAALQNSQREQQPQVLISDIRMKNGSGLELLQFIKQTHPMLPVIIMTAYSDLDSAVAAFKGGAFEYIAKPFDLSKVVELIRRALVETAAETAVVQDQEQAIENAPEMLGQALAMQEIFRAIGRLSQSNVTVLITGESGSGKELVARALHQHSPRAKQAFIALNTAAIPKDLLESELFGHERGAFTGAQAARRGRFEQADGGTLFLDEIGDMPFDLQTRLLRVLSDGHYYRVGGQQPLKANVRLIAATHQHLEQRVKDGVFREDLYHRLNVIRLRVPSLRERREDIPLLTKHFLHTSARSLGVEGKRMSDAAMTWITQLNFPGNVRQLENLCHWITVMAPAQVVNISDLPSELLPQSSLQTSEMPEELGLSDMLKSQTATRLMSVENAIKEDAIKEDASETMESNFANFANFANLSTVSSHWEQLLACEVNRLMQLNQSDIMSELMKNFETSVIQAALEHTQGHQQEAATRLGIGRNTISRKIKELEIKRK